MIPMEMQCGTDCRLCKGKYIPGIDASALIKIVADVACEGDVTKLNFAKWPHGWKPAHWIETVTVYSWRRQLNRQEKETILKHVISSSRHSCAKMETKAV